MAAIVQTKQLVLVAGLGALVLSAAIGALILRSIVRPIFGLRRSVETIAKGDYSQPVPYTASTDETGDLARSISVLKDGAAAMEQQQLDQGQRGGGDGGVAGLKVGGGLRSEAGFSVGAAAGRRRGGFLPP